MSFIEIPFNPSNIRILPGGQIQCILCLEFDNNSPYDFSTTIDNWEKLLHMVNKS